MAYHLRMRAQDSAVTDDDIGAVVCGHRNRAGTKKFTRGQTGYVRRTDKVDVHIARDVSVVGTCRWDDDSDVCAASSQCHTPASVQAIRRL